MIKSTSELGYINETIPTIETWTNYQEDAGEQRSRGYVNASFDMLQKIEKVMDINDFAQLKAELTKLYTERLNFVSHALENPWG